MDSRRSDEGQLCITLDLDWAGDEILRPVVEMLREAGAKATFFATHRSDVLAGLDAGQFEVGLHPNFNNSGGDLVGPTEELKAIYPRARGGRSHSLLNSSHVLQGYLRSGLVYESNLFLPMHESLRPVARIKGLVSIPIYWCDDVHFSRYDSFDLGDLRLETPGLKVLDFHPMHVFMNTSGVTHYESYRRHYQEPERLAEFVNREGRGVGTLFAALLEHLKGSGRRTHTMSEVRDGFLAAGGGWD